MFSVNAKIPKRGARGGCIKLRPLIEWKERGPGTNRDGYRCSIYSEPSQTGMRQYFASSPARYREEFLN